jgi:hypothetical protein
MLYFKEHLYFLQFWFSQCHSARPVNLKMSSWSACQFLPTGAWGPRHPRGVQSLWATRGFVFVITFLKLSPGHKIRPRNRSGPNAVRVDSEDSGGQSTLIITNRWTAGSQNHEFSIKTVLFYQYRYYFVAVRTAERVPGYQREFRPDFQILGQPRLQPVARSSTAVPPGCRTRARLRGMHKIYIV